MANLSLALGDSMMYVIQKENGWYVAANAGVTGSSYTPLLQKAKLYATEDEASRDKCGNETIVRVRAAFYN